MEQAVVTVAQPYEQHAEQADSQTDAEPFPFVVAGINFHLLFSPEISFYIFITG